MAGKRKKGGDEGRRSTRSRKVSERMKTVDDDTRKMVNQAKLDALENDNYEEENDVGDEDDEEFMMDDSDDELDPALQAGGKKKKGKKRAAARRTRGGAGASVPKTFYGLLELSGLLEAPEETAPNYVTAAARPSKASAPRRMCSVCGCASNYTCVRCGTRYCCRKCYTVHTETRCLKFVS